jgi:DNA-binding CsgD family transcriptional regulator
VAEKMKNFVNGVSFTKREVDIISCVINGKSAKSTATLLKISHNTVNVHMRNISNKVGSSSRDSIVKFIEKSDQYLIIHDHYLQHINRTSQNTKQPPDDNHSVETIPNAKKVKIFAIMMAILTMCYLQTIDKKYYIRPNVPLITNDMFVDREDLMKKIIDSFQKKNGIRVAILVGPGGSGKTTIARRYLFSQKEEVIWEINAENENVIKLSFDNLANLLARTKKQKEELNFIKSITDDDVKYTKLIFFVANILKNTNSWIILFENVNDFQIIKNYFPHDHRVWGSGKVIVTSRNADIKNTAFFNKQNIIDMGFLNDEK